MGAPSLSHWITREVPRVVVFLEKADYIKYVQEYFKCVYFCADNAHVLSHFSPVRLFETPWTVARQAPPSVRFPRQEYLSGLLFPPLGHLPHPGIELKSPSASALMHWQATLPLSHLGSPVLTTRQTEYLGDLFPKNN